MQFRLWDRDKGKYIESNVGHYCITLDGKVCALNAYGLNHMKNIEISEINLQKSWDVRFRSSGEEMGISIRNALEKVRENNK